MANWIIDPPLEYTLVGDSSIKLTIPNDTPPGTNIKVTYKKDNTCSKSTTITVECITCEPERDTDFEGCIDWFAHDCLNIDIEYTGDTMCTYQYLWYAWKYITEHNSSLDEDVREVAVGWFMANVFAELVPDPKIVTKFMRRGTGTAVELGQSNYSPWGGIPALTSTTQSVYEKEVAIYQARIDSAAMFAQFRHETYIEYKSLVSKARTELQNVGISQAKKNETSFDTLYDIREHSTGEDLTKYVPDSYNKYIPLVPSQSSGEQATDENYNTYDGSIMYGINDCDNNHYCTSDDLNNEYDYHYLPLYDKRHTTCYARVIFNINNTCNAEFENYIDNCEEVEYLTSNFAKGNGSGSRWRPGACTVGGRNIVFLCDDDIEQGYARDVCSHQKPSECASQEKYKTGNESYPSGHASWGYTTALLSILAYGNNLVTINGEGNEGKSKILTSERGKLYGNHRYIVKAHWPSDVLIGQVIASSCIGYLLGFEEFDTFFSKIYPSCNPQPTPTEVGDFVIIIDGYGTCHCDFDGELETTCPFNNDGWKKCCKGQDDSTPGVRAPSLYIIQKTGNTWVETSYNIEITSITGITDQDKIQYINENVGIITAITGGYYPQPSSRSGRFDKNSGIQTGTIQGMTGTYQYKNMWLQCPVLSTEDESSGDGHYLNPGLEPREVNLKITFTNSTGSRIIYYTFGCKQKP